jgi:hypothetical protein
MSNLAAKTGGSVVARTSIDDRKTALHAARIGARHTLGRAEY